MELEFKLDVVAVELELEDKSGGETEEFGEAFVGCTKVLIIEEASLRWRERFCSRWSSILSNSKQCQQLTEPGY